MSPDARELLKALGDSLNGDENARQNAMSVYLHYSLPKTICSPVSPEDMEAGPQGYRFGAIEVFPKPPDYTFSPGPEVRSAPPLSASSPNQP